MRASDASSPHRFGWSLVVFVPPLVVAPNTGSSKWSFPYLDLAISPPRADDKDKDPLAIEDVVDG